MTEFPIRIDKRFDDTRDILSNIAIIVLTALFIMLLTFDALFTRIYVVGSSMQRTLKGAPSIRQSGGDYVYICEYIEPKHGDIVVIDVGSRNLIKRVIALGGDTVRLDDGVLYLKKSGEENENLVDEPYVSPENNTDRRKNTFSAITIEEGYVFCMGDNRDNSEDSRGSYGCMKVEDIVGVVTDWSMRGKDLITGWNTFFDFTLPKLFGRENNL